MLRMSKRMDYCYAKIGKMLPLDEKALEEKDYFSDAELLRKEEKY